MKKLIALTLSLLMVLTLFAGCTPSQSNPANQPDNSKDQTQQPDDSKDNTADFSETGTLNLSWPSDYGTDLLPFPWNGRSTVVAMMFDPLVTLAADGVTIVDKLAESHKVSDDGLTYTFVLRDNATWHDGTPVTTDDVVFSINGYIKNPGSEFPALIGGIEGGDKVMANEADSCTGITVDGNTITMKLASPRNDFLTYLALVSILPKHLLKDVDPTLITKDETFLKNPVGCGAYKVKEVNIPNYFTLERYEDYYGEKAGIKNVTVTSYALGGADAVTAALISGSLDLTMGGVTNDINYANNIISSNPDITMTMIPATYARYFVYNTAGSTDGKYNDDMLKPEVRQALNLLIDKQAIANFYAGQADTLTTFVNPKSENYNTDIPLFERDVETAKKMLEDAGFDFNRTVRIEYHYKDQTTADIIAMITQNFAEAGIKVESSLSTGSLVDIIYDQRNWDLSYSGNYGLDEVDAFYYVSTTTNTSINKISADYDGTKAKVFDPLYHDFYATTDTAKKTEILKQLQVEGNKYMYAAPIYVMNKIALTNSAKLSYPEDLFTKDVTDWLEYRFEDWKLLQE